MNQSADNVFDIDDPNRSSSQSTMVKNDMNSIQSVKSSIPLWRRILSVIIITLLSLFTMFDRYVTAGVLERLEEYYSISNTWGGLLQTFYVLFYVICLLVVGMVGDRMSRRIIIIFSSTLWIIFMIASSFIPSDMFWLFLIIRSLTSIGIASVTALSPSLFADYFTGSARGYCLMVFFMSLPIGGSSSVAIGSFFLHSDNFLWSLRICPIIAIPLLIVTIIFLEEPIRGGLENNQEEEGKNDNTIVQDVMKILTVKSFWLSCLPTMLINFYLSGQSWWGSTYMENAIKSDNGTTNAFHGLSYNDWMGITSLITCIVGIFGSAIGVTFSESWRDGKGCFKRIKTIRAPALTVGIGSLLGIPLVFAYILLINKDIIASIVSTSINSIFCGGIFPLDIEIILLVIPSSRRAAALAIMNILMCVTGDAPAPFIIGFISDLFLNGSEDASEKFYSLQKSLLIAQGIASIAFIFGFINAYIFPSEMIEEKIDEVDE